MASLELGAISPISRTLQAVADIHNEVARGEKHFRQTTNALILSQLNEFLTMADDIIRERRQVENLRLDLDSAKSNLAQRPTQESEELVNLCQDSALMINSEIFKIYVNIDCFT